MMKQCKGCTQIKPVESFYNQVAAADKKDPYCKLCRARYSKQYYEQDKARKAAYNRSKYWADKFKDLGWKDSRIDKLIEDIRILDLHREEIKLRVEKIMKGVK